MKGDPKTCTVCGLEKRACRQKLGVSHHHTPDPRGLSSESGIRTLGIDTLLQMARGRAGEDTSVMALATNEVRRRAALEAASDRAPLWALSPFEQALHRAKETPLTTAEGYCRLS